MLMGEPRAVHWANHMDRSSPESGARYARHVAEELVYNDNTMIAQAAGFGGTWQEANAACDMAL
eukprot:12425483-Karenia_brevis.AAC.1